MYIQYRKLFWALVSPRKATQRICSRAGLAPCANSKPGKHLAADHPEVLRVLEYIKLQRASHEVHSLMVGNFDQVWSLAYRPSTSTLQKANRVDDEHGKKTALRRLHRNIQLALDMQPTGTRDSSPERKRPAVQGGRAASCSVDAWRLPHTLCTLSWIDGRVGRGFVTARHDVLSTADRDQANQARKCRHSKWKQCAGVTKS